MRNVLTQLVILFATSAAVLRAEVPPIRPDLNAAKPVATCKLQALPASRQPMYEQSAVLYSLQRPAEDPLSNYERTPLGDWQMPADADRSDPWLRLLVFAPKRPVVIDVAVFIEGKAFRDQRERWIDEVLADAKTQAEGSGESAESAAAGNNQGEGAGTNPAVEASVGDASRASPEAEKKVAGVAAKARQAPTMRERLMSYLATNGQNVDRQEIHWLIAEWGAGPAVVVLDPSLSWQRASLAPLLTYLDQDADGALSATEIAQAETLLKRADVDANDVLDVSELRRVTSHPPAPANVAGHALVLPLDANTEWEALAAQAIHIYGGKANSVSAASSTAGIKERIAHGEASLDGEAMRQLCAEPADITLRVDFGAENGEKGKGVSVLSVASDLAESSEAVCATADVVSLDIGGDYVEFSAAQRPAENEADASASQLAVGAVIDGNPIERLLDRDQDGRFTRRERQELAGLLAALDRDEDGQVARSEIPVPIRLAIALGPQVHQLLATPTGSARVIMPRDAAPKPPDWFVSMDKNRDRDVSRGEFLGTTEQFRQFDADGDGLLSIAEALKLDAGQ